jgi:hypothetical protein
MLVIKEQTERNLGSVRHLGYERNNKGEVRLGFVRLG